MGNTNQLVSYTDSLPPIFLATFDIDYKTNISEPEIKSLTDLSAEKLVSNVYLLYHPSHHIPVFLHNFLLQKALILNRVLSIMHLLKCYPGDSFSVPTPISLNNWSVFFKPNDDELKAFYKSLKKTTETVMHTFFCVVNSSITSQLRMLDLNEFSIETSALGKCLTKLANLDKKPYQSYLLKTGLFVEDYRDLGTIYDFKMSASLSAFFKLRITGLYLFNYEPSDSYTLKLMEIMQEDELQHFSIELCSNICVKIFPSLAKFHCLQSLTLSYVTKLTSDVKFLDLFAVLLNSFPKLKHFCLRGSCISNCLRTLMKQDCQTNYSGEMAQYCCMLHCGKLEYLDLSSCRLKPDDLLCLMESYSMKTLKYLDLSDNKLKRNELMEVARRSGSSLVVLNIEECLARDTDLSGFFSILESMPKLKSINMKDLPIKVEDLKDLSRVAKTMPELRQIFLDRPSNAAFDDCDSFKDFMSESKIDIFWHPEHDIR